MSSVLARGRARVLGALILLAGALVLSAGAGQAHAAGATIWPYANTVTPSGLTKGVQIAINHETGNLLVLNSIGLDSADPCRWTRAGRRCPSRIPHWPGRRRSTPTTSRAG